MVGLSNRDLKIPTTAMSKDGVERWKQTGNLILEMEAK